MQILSSIEYFFTSRSTAYTKINPSTRIFKMTMMWEHLDIFTYSPASFVTFVMAKNWEKVEVNQGKTEVGREGGAKGKFIRTCDDPTAHTAPILGAVGSGKRKGAGERWRHVPPFLFEDVHQAFVHPLCGSQLCQRTEGRLERKKGVKMPMIVSSSSVVHEQEEHHVDLFISRERFLDDGMIKWVMIQEWTWQSEVEWRGHNV
ncbi:hypothetical protein B0H14DRAFT_2637968 [Mycena olivaceomarginata]|nr:hypothetical protein B0H14DRAFT_2637968 [Mycena olivaceomarginata]